MVRAMSGVPIFVTTTALHESCHERLAELTVPHAKSPTPTHETLACTNALAYFIHIYILSVKGLQLIVTGALPDEKQEVDQHQQ